VEIPVAGRPRIAQEVRDLIRRMSLENPLWGATKMHGELLKLGFRVAQSTVSIYMVPRRGRPLQTWKTFRSWFRPLRFSSSLRFLFLATNAGSCCGLR
jgi:hypothetical protein